MTLTSRPRAFIITAALAILAIPVPPLLGVRGLLTLPALADTPSTSTTIVKKLAPGVTWTQEIDGDPPLIVDIVTVDLTAPGVKAEVGMGQDGVGGSDPTSGREDVSRYARRHHALVAVNGDYFPYTNDPLGIGIHNGVLFSEPWTGQGKGGPREVLGIDSADHRAIIDKLGFRGKLSTSPDTTASSTNYVSPSQAPLSPRGTSDVGDGPGVRVHGVDRQVGKDEIVAITPLFRGAKVNRPGGVDAVLTDVNLPLRANKRMTGKVLAIRSVPDGVDSVPADGIILAGGPGRGGAELTSALHPGDTVTFVLGVGTVADPAAGIKIAALPHDGDLPSRSGIDLDRTAWTWSNIDEALGGGPRLLSNGNVDIDATADGFDPGFVDFPNPRTAVGLSADGHTMVIAAVDGRQSISRGVSLADLAAILKRYGAVNAMNLDGGGSTVMAVDGLTVDSPGGAGFERPVADMLVVSSDRPYLDMPDWDPVGRAPDLADPPDQHLTVDKETLDEGRSEQITLLDGPHRIDPTQVIWQGPVPSTPAPPAPNVGARVGREETPANSTTLRAPAVRPPDTVPPTQTQQTPGAMPALGRHADAAANAGAGEQTNRGVTDQTSRLPIGFVDQHGLFTALHAGNGVITALYKGKLLSTTVTVNAKPLPLNIGMIRAVLSKGINGSDNTNTLAIHVVTPDGAPVANAALQITVSGGAVDKTAVTTDADGAATATVTWTAKAGGTITVSPGTNPGANAGLPTMLSVTVGE